MQGGSSMNDMINHKINYILQDQKGVKWYFYLSENKKIMYTTKAEEDWSTHEYINSQPIENFSVTIDNTGIIRILAYTTTRHLTYFEFTDGKWRSQVIERIYSRFQDIPYFTILSSSTGVHILYYIDHSLSRSGELLIHYFLHKGKWHGGRIWKFISDQLTKFQSLCIDNKDRLHMIFTQKWRQRYHLYHCVYDPAALSWIDPITIHSSSDNHDYELYVDSQLNLHILWAKQVEQHYEIKHLSKFAKDSSPEWKESVIHQSAHEIKVPLIMEEKDLYCFWKEGKSLYKMYSKDLGQTWSAPELLKESLYYDAVLHNLAFLDNQQPKTMKVWGQAFPDVKLAGINLRSISDHDNASSSVLSSSYERTEQKEYIDWINMKRAIESLKQDNKRMREAINNLFSQLDHINSIVYSLQDQMQINERSLFNINAQIKQLNFQIKQLHMRIRQASSKTYGIQQYQAQDIDEFEERKSTEQEIHDKIQIKTSEEKLEEKPKDKEEISKETDDQSYEEQNKDQAHGEQNLDLDKYNSKEETQGELEDQKEEKAEEKIDSQTEENNIDNATEQYEKKEEKNTQRITLGNTVILINPENPEDL